MSKYRILIIDDDEDARKLLAMMLRPRFEVVEAHDGLDALSRLDEAEPDLALIDIMMPLMDGYQVCEAIRRHPRFKTMQVIFLSAHGDRENIKKSYAAGGNFFLTKPVDPERVLRNIDLTIEHTPPPQGAKRYQLEELHRLEAERKAAARPQLRPQPEPERPPASLTPSAQPTPAPPVATSQPGLKPRLLLVDDDTEMLQMLDLTLRDDYEITTASNGMEAIERIVDYTPDLLLLDIMMPKMNGYQLLQSIRRNAFMSYLPVVILSAKCSLRDQDYAKRLGATLFLPKPYKIEALLTALGSIIQAPGFKIRSKKVALGEIRDRAFVHTFENETRAKDMERQRRYDAILDSFSEGNNEGKPGGGK